MGKITVEYSHKELMQKLETLHDLQVKTHAQACKTNGRVTKIEAKSWGIWAASHPFKFAGGVVLLLLILISDIRHPIFEAILKLFL